MYNLIMSSPIEEQIDWVKQQIMDQVDAGMEHFTLDYCAHLQDAGALQPGKDRIACLTDYFVQCIELELARRYA